MVEYRVYRSGKFDRDLEKQDNDFLNKVNKIETRLVENPYMGDPLGVSWFREKRIEGFRVYYLIYDDLHAIFMVRVSGKKDQQKVIDTVRLLFDFYREEIESLVDKDRFI